MREEEAATMDEALAAAAEGFEATYARVGAVVSWLRAAETARLAHAELEVHLGAEARELFRQLFQDHLDLRAARELRLPEVADADGVARRSAEADHDRAVTTVFGEVTARRIAYRQGGHQNLYPADAVANWPTERHSHGLRECCAIEAARGSFAAAAEAVRRATGQAIAKRQVEELAGAAAVDFDDFYAQARPGPASAGDLLVVSVDAKGIVMRSASLTKATQAAAARATQKLHGRLSKGEKANRKRMAEVGAVYTVEPVPRSPTDVMAHSDEVDAAKQAPKAAAKWLTASLVDDAANVISSLFDEAERRDPDHRRAWVGLVDGNRHQIERIEVEATARGIEVTIVVDWVHVLEYLWSAAWSFFTEGDPAAEDWVGAKA
ncbi:MAG: ISKra4 family transposase, partial [Actinomycetota bacterium]